MFDVLIVGAGPAGSVAATVLARAGARVRLVDRATFPREKLCGDTVNPGTLAILRRLRMAAAVESCGLPVEGMRLTAENGTSLDGRYPDGIHGRALVRSRFDWLLLQDALAAGAEFEPGVVVRSARVEAGQVSGVLVGGRRTGFELRARVTIAADGRRSALAFGLGAARHPRRPRRWAIGAYLETPGQPAALGEMHIRTGRYIGVAPVPGGVTNVCLVKPWQPGDVAIRDPAALIRAELARDSALRTRFADARLVAPPVVLGPLAVDAREAGLDGLLLAGDAAGFIDPMTGDGIRFAVRGAELAATAALETLANGWDGVRQRLADRRRLEFARKWRFNRSLRTLVASPYAMAVASEAARIAPSLFQRMIKYAGDVDTV